MILEIHGADQKTLANFRRLSKRYLVATVASRITAALDQISAPTAFVIMLVGGGVDGFFLFYVNVAQTNPWYIRALPFIGFVAIALVALLFIASSRPRVTPRQMAKWSDRAKLQFQYLGRLATVHAAIGGLLVIPIFFVAQRHAASTVAEPSAGSDKPAASIDVAALFPSTSATASSTTPPSASAAKPDKPIASDKPVATASASDSVKKPEIAPPPKDATPTRNVRNFSDVLGPKGIPSTEKD